MRGPPDTEMLHQPTDKTITRTISIIKIELLHHLQDIIIANVAIIGDAGIALHDKDISNQEVTVVIKCLRKDSIVRWIIESPQQDLILMETGIPEGAIGNTMNQTELIIRPLQSSNLAVPTPISIQPSQGRNNTNIKTRRT